jgi:phosphatidylglycerophosphate synthase
MSTPDRRRPVDARSSSWIRSLAAWLARLGLPPNAISAASVVFSGLAALAILSGATRFDVTRIELFVIAAVLLELRLLANLLDGLVAVEGKLGSKSGEIWNELPDRFSDAIALVAAGYAAGGLTVSGDLVIWGSVLGWSAALSAVITAYVRALGSSTGASAHFEGPMAKQRRMDVLAAGCVLTAFEPAWGWNGQSLAIALALIFLGSLITIARRTRNIVRELEGDHDGR